MQIKEKIMGDVAVLTLKGKLMGGPDTMTVHEKVRSLIADKIKKVVIDLGGVKWMNSSGLGVLIACHTSLRNANGELKLASVTDKVQSLFMITKLVTIFQTFETVDRAVASFKS